MLKGASRDFLAQFIFVSQGDHPGLAAAIVGNGGELVTAPVGSTRAEMCDLGMSQASGSIVAVRDIDAVGDAQWLDAYRAVLPVREAVKTATSEAVVMDTLVAGRAPLADSAVSYAAENRYRAASIEMAAAV